MTTSKKRKPADPPRRVLRGGTWEYPTASYMRAAYRDDYSPLFRYFFIGFRCAQRGCRQPVLKND